MCHSAGSVENGLDPCCSLAPSKGCRNFVLHWSPAWGSRGRQLFPVPKALSPLFLSPCSSQGCPRLHSGVFCHFSPWPLLQLHCSPAQRAGLQPPLDLHPEQPWQLPGTRAALLLWSTSGTTAKPQVSAHKAIAQKPLNCLQGWVRI